VKNRVVFEDCYRRSARSLNRDVVVVINDLEITAEAHETPCAALEGRRLGTLAGGPGASLLLTPLSHAAASVTG
jgi:hypothetical protein